MYVQVTKHSTGQEIEVVESQHSNFVLLHKYRQYVDFKKQTVEWQPAHEIRVAQVSAFDLPPVIGQGYRAYTNPYTADTRFYLVASWPAADETVRGL
jgi:hypothetical protein